MSPPQHLFFCDLVLAGTMRILRAQLSPASIPGGRDILNTRESEKNHALILDKSRLLPHFPVYLFGLLS